jgi:hypothetical protein
MPSSPAVTCVGQRVDVDLGATARRARHDLELARAQVERLQDLVADLDLLDRRRRQRHPDRVADARESSAPKATADLMVPWNAGPASVTPRCSGQSPARPAARRPDHDHRVVVLDRDLEVAEAVLLEQRGLPQGRLDQRLGGGLAVLLHQPLVERAGVDADADRDMPASPWPPGDLFADLVVELA